METADGDRRYFTDAKISTLLSMWWTTEGSPGLMRIK